MNKSVKIMEEEWDYLIILDACRYDYFSKLCGDYLKGKLEKVYSPASCTSEWCQKSFKEYYKDVIYISANPYINSKVGLGGFNARTCFFKVIDLWDWGWDLELGTVHPEKVNETVQEYKDKYAEKRFIIHYLQPHEPYINYNLNSVFYRPRLTRSGLLVGIGSNKTNKMLEKLWEISGFLPEHLIFLGKKVSWKIFSGNPSWKMREFLNLPPKTPMDAVRREAGNIGLRKAYIENLKIALTYVAKLVKLLSGVIIVTSDHGELLGESGCYGHPCSSTNPVLRDVPWFIIDRKENRRRIDEKELVTRKIKQLKGLNLI
jgi:hypothetical protein